MYCYGKRTLVAREGNVYKIQGRLNLASSIELKGIRGVRIKRGRLEDKLHATQGQFEVISTADLVTNLAPNPIEGPC